MGQPDFCVDTEEIGPEMIRRVNSPKDVYVHRHYKRQGKSYIQQWLNREQKFKEIMLP